MMGSDPSPPPIIAIKSAPQPSTSVPAPTTLQSAGFMCYLLISFGDYLMFMYNSSEDLVLKVYCG